MFIPNFTLSNFSLWFDPNGKFNVSDWQWLRGTQSVKRRYIIAEMLVQPLDKQTNKQKTYYECLDVMLKCVS